MIACDSSEPTGCRRAVVRDLEQYVHQQSAVACAFQDLFSERFLVMIGDTDQQDARQTLGLRFPRDNTNDPEIWGRLGSCKGLDGSVNQGSSSRTDAHIAVQLHGTTVS